MSDRQFGFHLSVVDATKLAIKLAREASDEAGWKHINV